MNNTSRRGGFLSRTWLVRAALVCLAGAAAIALGAGECLAYKDFPLRPLDPAPIYSTEPGNYGVALGQHGRYQNGVAQMTIELPAPPIGAYLYLSGIDPSTSGGDPNVKVVFRHYDANNVLDYQETIYRVPVAYAAISTRGNYVNRRDITNFLRQGRNKITVSGYDMAIPEAAFVYAVYEDPGAPSGLIQVQDGADIGFYGNPPPLGPDSEVVSFAFEPSLEARAAHVLIAMTDGDPGRGDEIFGFTGTGVPSDQLFDTDGDKRIDIVDRREKLGLPDWPPPDGVLAVDPANRSGALEADSRAFSIEEDCLGVARDKGGCAIGVSYNVVEAAYTIPAGHAHADFQVQSENPENGDSFVLFLALNKLPVELPNPAPDILVVKGADPTVLHAPSGDVTFTVVVTNPPWNLEALNLTSLVDSDFGDLTLRGCFLPPTLAVGESSTCTFVARVERAVEDPHRNTVTAAGTGAESGIPVDASADAVVEFVEQQLGFLGDRVWLDLDGQGDQDPGEPGINAVPVFLKDAITGATVAATTTATHGSVSGYYGFADLPPGSYRVEVVAPAGLIQTYDLDGLGTPAAAARALAIGEIAGDVDFGYAQPGFEVTKTASIEEGYPGDGVTYTFVVTNTGAVTLDNVHVVDPKVGYVGDTGQLLPGASKELTHAGSVLPTCEDPQFTPPQLCGTTGTRDGWCSLPNTVTATWRSLTDTADDCVNIKPFGSIGDYVWEDRDQDGVQDAGEPGIPGVTVTLAGAKSATAVTDGNGTYRFTDLKAGNYSVTSGGKPGFTATTPETLSLALGIGQVYLDADFGYWKPAWAPGIAVTKVADPTFGYLFRADPTTPWPYALVLSPLDVTYTVQVTNSGNEPLENVTVTDDPASIAFAYGAGDTNLDGKLDLTETWVYTAAGEYTQPGVYPDTVTAQGRGLHSRQRVDDSADASVEAVGCGQCLGKVSVLSLRYNGRTAATITVEVLNRKFADRIAFSGRVQPGEVFTFGPLSSRIGGFNGTLGTNIEVRVNGGVIAAIHTSCSQPIYPGQDWGPNGALAAGLSGPVTVMSGSSKHGGLLCPLLEQ